MKYHTKKNAWSKSSCVQSYTGIDMPDLGNMLQVENPKFINYKIE